MIGRDSNDAKVKLDHSRCAATAHKHWQQVSIQFYILPRQRGWLHWSRCYSKATVKILVHPTSLCLQQENKYHNTNINKHLNPQIETHSVFQIHRQNVRWSPQNFWLHRRSGMCYLAAVNCRGEDQQECAFQQRTLYMYTVAFLDQLNETKNIITMKATIYFLGLNLLAWWLFARGMNWWCHWYPWRTLQAYG